MCIRDSYINIPRETIQLLREYHAEQESWREAVGDRWANTGYVFTRDTGEPMHPDSINGWLIAFSERHGLPHINPHAFRHAMASILIYSGTDILSISKRLGHTTTNTTLNFYGHLLQKADAQDVYKRQILYRQGKSKALQVVGLWIQKMYCIFFVMTQENQSFPQEYCFYVPIVGDRYLVPQCF